MKIYRPGEIAEIHHVYIIRYGQGSTLYGFKVSRITLFRLLRQLGLKGEYSGNMFVSNNVQNALDASMSK